MEKYKVVFHLDEDESDRVKMVLNNIGNLILDLGHENVEIELVSNGKGVRAFLKEQNLYVTQIEQLQKRGVRFVVCANTMRHLNLEKDALLEVVEVVPAGVSELVKKQAQGWAYIRP